MQKTRLCSYSQGTRDLAIQLRDILKGNINPGLYVQIHYKSRKNLQSTTYYYLTQLLLQGPKLVSLHTREKNAVG